MAYLCGGCMETAVGEGDALCAGCMSEALPSEDPGVSGWRLPTGPVPDWPALFEKLRRQLNEHITLIDREIFAVTKTGARVNKTYVNKLGGMSRQLSMTCDRLATSERQWREHVKREEDELTPGQLDEQAVTWLCREDRPADAKREAVRRILGSLGESHLEEVV